MSQVLYFPNPLSLKQSETGKISCKIHKCHLHIPSVLKLEKFKIQRFFSDILSNIDHPCMTSPAEHKGGKIAKVGHAI